MSHDAMLLEPRQYVATPLRHARGGGHPGHISTGGAATCKNQTIPHGAGVFPDDAAAEVSCPLAVGSQPKGFGSSSFRTHPVRATVQAPVGR